MNTFKYLILICAGLTLAASEEAAVEPDKAELKTPEAKNDDDQPAPEATPGLPTLLAPIPYTLAYAPQQDFAQNAGPVQYVPLVPVTRFINANAGFGGHIGSLGGGVNAGLSPTGVNAGFGLGLGDQYAQYYNRPTYTYVPASSGYYTNYANYQG